MQHTGCVLHFMVLHVALWCVVGSKWLRDMRAVSAWVRWSAMRCGCVYRYQSTHAQLS